MAHKPKRIGAFDVRVVHVVPGLGGEPPAPATSTPSTNSFAVVGSSTGSRQR